jgi:predicted aldo/keto reductase-like oxidoreductase
MGDILPPMSRWTRRQFLRESLVRGGAVVGLGASLSRTASAATPPAIRRRVVLGRTGLEVPDICFGSFALDGKAGGNERVVAHALDRGITHFDTAEGYTKGRAEELLGRALRGRRDRVTITTKFWAEPHHTAEHQMKVLEQSLRRLRSDYVDIYLNHAVNDVARLESEEWQAFTARAKEQGKIRFAGMSGHSGRLTECLGYALDHDLVDVVLVAYNFAQQPSFREQATRYFKELAADFDLVTTHPELPEMIRRAHEKNIGVMVMKTLKGAERNWMGPYEAPGRSFAQSAFRWVLSDPNVDALTVTMKSTAMVDEYVEASGQAPDREDLAMLTTYERLAAGHSCQVGCGECASSCPAGVPIPDVMRVRMYHRSYAVPDVAAAEYARFSPDAEPCLSCSGAPCASACPNGLPIADWNRGTHRRLGGHRA